jgi:hypothetical protein
VTRCLQALALAALAAGGCASTQQHVHGNPAPATKAHWTIAVPSKLRALPEVDALIRARGERFTVQVVELDAAVGTAESRLESLRASLAKLPHGTAMDEHLLVVGSPSTISMGPWNFEGVKTPIATDWLLTNDATVDGHSVASGEWQPALAGMPARTVGRIPFDDARLVAAAARATLAHDASSSATAGTALLGASGTAYAWPMATVRRELRNHGWSASLRGRGGSCDGSADGFQEGWTKGGSVTPPSMVIAAGSQYEPLDGVGGPRGIRWIRRTDPASRAPSPQANAASGAAGAASILVAFVPQFARADNPDIADLFAWQQASAVAGFTADVAASPMGPALAAMQDLPLQLADGRSLGLAVETSRAHFWHVAEDDLFAWMPASREDRAVAALSAVIYGDPALQAIRTTSPTDGSNKVALEKAVDQDTAAIAVGEDTAGTATATGASSDGSMSLFTVGVIAAVAILAVIVSRRSAQ